MKKFVVSFILTAAPWLLGAATDWSKVDLTNPELYVQGKIIVRFKDGVNLDETRSVLSSNGETEVRRLSQLNALTLALPQGRSVKEALEYYESRPDVLYAEPALINHVFWTPNDPFYSYQWEMDSGHLNMPAAWDKERGSSGVIVAIVDTGIAYEDYAIPSYEAAEVSSLDGYYHKAPDLNSSQFVAGYDFIHNDSHPNDQYSHGTHVAGTVAQATNNGIGVAGMAPDCKLMPVQVLDYTGSGPADVIADGIMWAADNGAYVINLSLGGEPGAQSQVEHDAVIYATNKGVVVVAAAGNQAVGELSYPGGFEECIGVAALDYNDDLSPYSQWGPGLDISAPGGNTAADENYDGYVDGILQCTYAIGGDGTYGAQVDSFAYMFYQGTSMATPHVAGLAALLISHGITGVQNVKNAIYSTAVDLGASGYDTYYGYGAIDPVAALDYGGSTDTSSIAVPILQNPLLSQYVDIWVVPTSGTLTSAPDVIVTLNGYEESVVMYSVSGSEAYMGDYTFTESGTATIDVTAGSNTKSRTFTVTSITAMGGTLSSPDSRVRLTIPEGAVSKETYFTLIPEKTEQGALSSPHAIPKPENVKPFGDACRVGPASTLSSNATLAFSYAGYDLSGTDNSTLVILRFENGTWARVPCLVDPDHKEIVANPGRLGIFQLASDPDARTPELPKALAIELLSSTETKLRLSVNKVSPLSLAVFDAAGRKVTTLIEGQIALGVHDVSWDGRDAEGRRCNPGVYFVRLESPDMSKNLKILRLR